MYETVLKEKVARKVFLPCKSPSSPSPSHHATEEDKYKESTLGAGMGPPCTCNVTSAFLLVEVVNTNTLLNLRDLDQYFLVHCFHYCPPKSTFLDIFFLIVLSMKFWYQGYLFVWCIHICDLFIRKLRFFAAPEKQFFTP